MSGGIWPVTPTEPQRLKWYRVTVQQGGDKMAHDPSAIYSNPVTALGMAVLRAQDSDLAPGAYVTVHEAAGINPEDKLNRLMFTIHFDKVTIHGDE